MALSEATRKEIRKFALKNAIDFGKAEVGAVLGKILANEPSLRSDVATARSAVEEVVREVNGMKAAELKRAFSKYEGEFERKAEEIVEKSSKHKMEVDGAEEGKVVTRFPPEPGGYITIGNMKQCMLSHEIAKRYEGKIYLYFDDTNPEKCRQEYVDATKRDTAWMGVKFAKEYYASDFIGKVYDAGRRLIRQGDAYVCMCSADDVEKKRKTKSECKHRKQTPARNLSLFEEMIKGKHDEGKAIVRLKGDMKSDNATFRDPTLFRIKKMKHYRQGGKYVVWPTYHLNTPVVDSINGVTDVVRDKSYEIWDGVHKSIISNLGLTAPRMHYEARLKIEGQPTGKRVIRELVANGKLTAWDDPRLITIAALRRRGILPEAIKNFVLRFGFSMTDATVPMEMLLAENRKLIDPVAKHLFFVRDPVKLMVKGEGPRRAKLRLHPAKNIGFREYEAWDEFYISRDDADALEVGSDIRLKDFLGVRILSKLPKEITAEPAKAKEGRIVQWVSGRDHISCSVLMPELPMDDKGEFKEGSLKTAEGYVEAYADKLKEHEIVQFERFGYCILDDKKALRFILVSK